MCYESFKVIMNNCEYYFSQMSPETLCDLGIFWTVQLPLPTVGIPPGSLMLLCSSSKCPHFLFFFFFCSWSIQAKTDVCF